MATRSGVTVSTGLVLRYIGDTIVLKDSGAVTDTAFTNVRAIEQVTLANGVNWVTLGENAEAAAESANATTSSLGTTGGTLIVDGSLSSGVLTLDASAMSGPGKLQAKGGSANDAITGGGGADTLNGGGGADTIVGGAGDDVLTGGVGADMLTGGLGSDNFVFLYNSQDSLAAAFDTLADFTSGSDHIKIGHIVAAADLGAVSGVGTGSLATDLALLLTTSNLHANGAAQVTLTGASGDAGTYVVINNATAGFSATTDNVVKLLGAPTLTGTDFIT